MKFMIQVVSSTMNNQISETGSFTKMKRTLILLALTSLLTACGSETPSTSAVAETNNIATANTPISLSGDKGHIGPNPHARLTPSQHISVAMQHEQEGRVAEALDVLSRAIAENPNHPALYGARGSMLLNEKRVSDALKDLEKAVKLAPNSAVLRVNRSQAYRKFNLYKEAMADLNRAVELDPKLMPARFNRGVLLFQEGKYKEALADYDLCVELAPTTPGPYFNRAVTRDALGDSSGAIADLNKFIEMSPNKQWQKVARETLETWRKRDAADNSKDS